MCRCERARGGVWRNVMSLRRGLVWVGSIKNGILCTKPCKKSLTDGIFFDTMIKLLTVAL